MPPGSPYGPFIPQGMPPGTSYGGPAERPPDGVTYYRIYAWIIGVLSVIGALAGVVMMFLPMLLDKGSTSPGSMLETWLGGLFYFGMGAAQATPVFITLFAGRKPWVHTLGTVVIGLGMMSCCMPILIPLLIVWMKPETKQWFGAT